MKKTLLIYNPISGTGKAKEHALKLESALSGRFAVQATSSQKSYSPDALKNFVTGHALVIVVGGDGTLQPLLSACAESGSVLTMFPAGNESLFAKEFSIPHGIMEFAEGLSTAKMEEVYFGIANETPFLHMLSGGFDSQIIAKLHDNRSGPAGNIGYVLPIVKTICHYVAPTINLVVDGKVCVEREKGYVIVANTKQYAGALSPAPDADPKKQNFEVYFYPFANILPHLNWSWRFFLKKSVDVSRSRHFAGQKIELRFKPADFPFQADGEYVGAGPFTAAKSVRPLKVLRF